MKPTHTSSNHGSLKSGFMYQKKKQEKKTLERALSLLLLIRLWSVKLALCKVSLHRASIFRKKQSFSCQDVVMIFLLWRQKAELYKRATDLDFQQLSNQSAMDQ